MSGLLTDVYFSESLAAFDKALGRLTDRSFSPPQGLPVQYRKPFAQRDLNEQRAAIGDHLRQNPSDESLFSEALSEHRLAPEIRAAFVAGDLVQFAMLSDRAIREYVGSVVQSYWDSDDIDEHDRVQNLLREESGR